MAKAAPSVTRTSSLSDRSDRIGDVSAQGVENQLRSEDSAFSSLLLLFAALFGCLSALSRLNPSVPTPSTCVTLPAQGQLIGERGGKLARRRFQNGSFFFRGKKNPVWVGRWREDVIVDGRIRREYRSEVLGSKSDYPTKRLALRELGKRLSVVTDFPYLA